MIIYHLESPCYWLGWHDVFCQLANSINAKYDTTYHHKMPNISIPGDYLFMEEFQTNIRDCDFVIYDKEKDSLKAISWGETYSDPYIGGKNLLQIFKSRNNKNDILLVTQQSSWFNVLDDTITSLNKNYNFTLKSTPFYTFQSPIDHDIFWEERKNIKHNDLIDQIFFLSTTRREDPFKLREMGLCSESPGGLSIEDYLKLSTKYKVGLSISSLSELCYRDIEYMAVGVPMLRLEYVTTTNPPLIPNYHYIAVDRKKYNIPGTKDNPIWSTSLERAGGESYVNAYKERFLEVKDDYEFLDFISLNAREYYKEYCSPTNRVNYLLSLLNL